MSNDHRILATQHHTLVLNARKRTHHCPLLLLRSFKPASRMGSHEDVMAKCMLALTLKVEGGMWLSATQRCAAA
jgi:hypothetical protein